MQIIKSLLGSKKFVACGLFLVFSVAAAIGSQLLGITLTEDQLWQAAAVVSAYLVGQGAADLGKESQKAALAHDKEKAEVKAEPEA